MRTLALARKTKAGKRALEEARRGPEAHLRNVLAIQRMFLDELRDLRTGGPGRPAPAPPGEHTDWSVEWMLPYFWIDWGRSKTKDPVTPKIRKAVRKHLAKRSSNGFAVVLGSGASGLVRDLSDQFQHVMGVDLSLPTLLLAKRLLDGEGLSLDYFFHDRNLSMRVKQVRLPARNRSCAAKNVSLVAADIFRLPIGDRSVSCVTTQYVLDVIPNQTRLISEIRRILRPGGIWVNFGIPSTVDPAERISLPLISAFARKHGFTECESSLGCIDHLDMRDLWPISGFSRHVVLFFVFQKPG